jgi:2-polyprenyl-3-methyl-5-hydroxy-6-metoxy-1,4-benzoquinol methylase
VTVDHMPSNASTYLLGHADVEVRRLMLQAQLYDTYTEHALRLAGLRPGMRVLDVGCGPGDVSFVAARLVGSTGAVLGVDAEADILDLARTRAADHGFSTVRFQQTTVGDLALDQPVDAVIGRLILMHLPDPVESLRQLAGLVRPGGIVAFSEFDMTGARGVPDGPLWLAARDTIIDTFTNMGLDPTFAATLPTLFKQAGLSTPQLALGAPIGGPDHAELIAFVVETLQSLRPARDKLGLVTREEFTNAEALRALLRDELATSGGVATTPALITAWSRV